MTGNKGRGIAVVLFDHFEKVSSFRVVQGCQAQIIQDKEIGFSESLHETYVAASGSGESDLIEELRRAQAKDSEVFTADLLSQGKGKEGLAGYNNAHRQQSLSCEFLLLLFPILSQDPLLLFFSREFKKRL